MTASTTITRLPSSRDLDVAGKRVLLRTDLNCPIDPESGHIVDDTRIERSLPTIRDLAVRGARLVVLAHQGDSLDYENFVSTEEHAARLGTKLGRPVQWIDDVAGPAARHYIASLDEGQILLLDNVRIHGEELSTFERDVRLTREQMANTYLVRHLAPLFDYYVNDAFATAHRAAPSMIAFQHLLPSAAGLLLEAEIDGLARVVGNPAHPVVFLLGGLKVSDGFSMMRRTLDEGLTDKILTAGVLGELFVLAEGLDIGSATERFLGDRGLLRFVEEAEALLEIHRARIAVPTDVAVVDDGSRQEMSTADLPADAIVVDIGERTICAYEESIAAAGTVFVNGPAGMYEEPAADVGTRRLWQAVARTTAFTAIGGGDTVASARRFIDLADIGFVSTGGGALIRYVSGQSLPLLDACSAAATSS